MATLCLCAAANFLKSHFLSCLYQEPKPFLYIWYMKTLVITPKNDSEFKFIADLLKKLGVGSSTLTQDELEDIGMSKLMRGVDKSKKASRNEINKKLSS